MKAFIAHPDKVLTDRMLLLDGGRVAAAGRAAEVLTPEVLAEVFRWPVAVSPWRDGSPQMTPLRPGERDQGAVS